MPRQWPALQACDICHARKIKCDRQDPCSSCTSAGLECERSRVRRRTTRGTPNSHQVQEVLNHITRLEKSLKLARNGPRTPPSPTNPATIPAASSSSQAAADAPSTVDIPGDLHPNPASLVDVHPTIKTAQQCFQNALCSGAALMPQARKDALQSALTFLQELNTHRAQRPVGGIADSATKSEYSETFIDLLQVAFDLMSYPGNDLSGLRSELFAHTSPRTLQRMGTALLQNDSSVSSLDKLLYRICIYSFAYLTITNLDTSTMLPVMQQLLPRSKIRFRTAVMSFVARISIMAPNSLTLLQGLLSGAFIMQDNGETHAFWTLVSSACRVCTALGGLWLADGKFGESESDRNDAKACLMYCYVFDKAVAMNFSRPALLPPMDIDVIRIGHHLLKDHPSKLCHAVLMKIATAMDDHLRPAAHPIASPRSRMEGMIDEIAHLRTLSDDPRSQDDCMLVDFVYHSTMVSIIRHDRNQVQDALQHARLCLTATKDLARRCNDAQRFANYVAWSTLLHPLTPFFMVFCNIVLTSNGHDFHLMQDVTNVLCGIGEVNRTIVELQRLCMKLVAICTPLVGEANVSQEQSGFYGEQNESHHAQSAGGTGNNIMTSMGVWNNDGLDGDASFWQLFDTVPTLDWMNAEV